MSEGKKLVMELTAYDSRMSRRKTGAESRFESVDEVVVVDDNSSDRTVAVGRELGINHIIKHDVNRGYGGNQKSCYHKALELGGDIVIMLHPDYQYTPKLIPSMAYLIANDVYQVVLGSRTLGKGALHSGMPLYKYFFNRVLTFFDNVMLRQKLADYHTGYRAFSREILQRINYDINSEDFVFDNQMLSQIIYLGYEIAEITCPTRYFEEASSINFRRSVVY